MMMSCAFFVGKLPPQTNQTTTLKTLIPTIYEFYRTLVTFHNEFVSKTEPNLVTLLKMGKAKVDQSRAGLKKIYK